MSWLKKVFEVVTYLWEHFFYHFFTLREKEIYFTWKSGLNEKKFAKLGQKKQIRKGLESENPSKIEKKSSNEAVCITIFYQILLIYHLIRPSSQQFDFQLIGKLKKMHIRSFFIQKQLLLMIFTFLSVIDLADLSLVQLCHVTKLNEGRIG